MDNIIQFRNVSKYYKSGNKKTFALKDVSFSIPSGQDFTIIGPSGSGKTTLLHMIGGLDTPNTGKVAVNGIDLTSMSDDELSAFRNKTIGFVFQFFNLQGYLTAKGNVLMPSYIAGENNTETEKRAEELLDRVGLKDRENHYPTELSGGEMQRVAIARALMNNPKILLADEPTGNLDKKNSKKVLEIFEDISKGGVSVIFITHDESIRKIYKHSIHLDKGVLVNSK